MAEPRHHTRRSSRDTRGPGVAAVARAKGSDLMPWQRNAADVALEIDPATGLPWYSIVVVTVQRRAGKTKLESDVADHRCLTQRDARCWYTAQTGKDASKWMREHHVPALGRAHIFGRPRTASARYTITKRAGHEGVDWHHGSSFHVFAPLRDALHGEYGDLIFEDEVWALSPDQGADLRQAVRPIMLTRPGSQLWVVSTLGDDSSTYLDGYVEMARAAVDDPNARVCIVDYGLEPDDDPEDLDVIAARHPAFGHTVTMDGLAAAREEFRADPRGDDIAGWTRAYGNRPTRTRETAIPAAIWQAAGRSKTPRPDDAKLAIDVTPDQTRAAVAAGWRDPEGSPAIRTNPGDGFVEIIHAGPNDRQFPALVAEIARRRRVPVAADRGSPGALDVMDALARNHPDVAQHLTTQAEYAADCGKFDRGVREDTVHHFNDPGLDAAVEVATKRPMLDGGFGWGRKSSAGSIAELVAATLALGAHDRTPKRASFRVLSATRAGS